MSEVNAALARLLERHRIVLWYDTRQELRADFEAVSGKIKAIARTKEPNIAYDAFLHR